MSTLQSCWGPGGNPGAYRCKYTYCLPLTQQSAVFLCSKEELTMLNIELQHFGGRGAVSYNLSGSSIALPHWLCTDCLSIFNDLFSYFGTLHFHKQAKHKTPKKLITSSFLRVLWMVSHRRFELRTPWLKVKCSADWANGSYKIWLG